ncbi:hypothetical protein D3C85_959180 [compost metagenome]
MYVQLQHLLFRLNVQLMQKAKGANTCIVDKDVDRLVLKLCMQLLGAVVLGQVQRNRECLNAIFLLKFACKVVQLTFVT